jgi:hypothetical protein
MMQMQAAKALYVRGEVGCLVTASKQYTITKTEPLVGRIIEQYLQDETGERMFRIQPGKGAIKTPYIFCYEVPAKSCKTIQGNWCRIVIMSLTLFAEFPMDDWIEGRMPRSKAAALPSGNDKEKLQPAVVKKRSTDRWKDVQRSSRSKAAANLAIGQDKAQLQPAVVAKRPTLAGLAVDLTRVSLHRKEKQKHRLCVSLHRKEKQKPRSCSRHAQCEHGRRANQCKECKGCRICPHGNQKLHCKECPRGKCWCKHNRQRSKCKLCNSE